MAIDSGYGSLHWLDSLAVRIGKEKLRREQEAQSRILRVLAKDVKFIPDKDGLFRVRLAMPCKKGGKKGGKGGGKRGGGRRGY